MAVLTNTVLTTDVAEGLNIEFVSKFNQEVNDLMTVLGIVSPEVMAAGTTLYQVKVTGSLNEDAREEGDIVPLSKYGTETVGMESLTPKAYRKLTTAEAVLKSGVTNAVLREDHKMLKDIRNNIVSEFYTALDAAGASTASGTSLQDAFAQSDAKLADLLETNHDSAGSVVHFVNPYDIADYLGKASVTTQTMFGMTYLESFLGVERILVTNKVTKGTLFSTPAENLHLYGVDFASLSNAGLPYTTLEGGLIGVSHEPTYERVGVITNALTGVKVMPEVVTYIVKATITPGA